MNELIFKNASNISSLLDNYQSKNESSTPSPFDLKILIESNMLVNFLFDYTQDSSKLSTKSTTTSQQTSATSVTYFNSHFNLIETVSIILNDVYLSISNHDAKKFDFCIAEVSMFINTDDQSLNDEVSDINDDDSLDKATRRKFFSTRKLRITLDRKSERLLAERKLLETKVAQNELLEVSFDTIVANFLYKYDFAKLFDHVLNLRKCLLQMHKREKIKDYSGDLKTLSYDFWLSVKQIKLTVEDDPFEVNFILKFYLFSHSSICG